MRLVLDRRAQRLLRRLPRYRLYSIAELALLALLAVQGARLLLTLVTPVSPVGDWRTGQAAPIASSAIFGLFDPFFRLSAAGGPVVVTALNLKLTGTRADQASGRGSAIIGLPDGSQASYAVGEEIMPGVTLKAVGFDNVTISRGGADEQIFIDQSTPATVVAPQAQQMAPPLGAPEAISARPQAAPGASFAGDLLFTPRMAGGTVTGITLQPRGSGEAFRASGLQPGDVLVAVDGRRIAGIEDAQSVQSRLAQGGSVAIDVERAGRTISLRVGAGR